MLEARDWMLEKALAATTKTAQDVVWDHIAVYAPGRLWQDVPPEPAYAGDPVVRKIDRAKDAVLHLLQTGTNQAAVEK